MYWWNRRLFVIVCLYYLVEAALSKVNAWIQRLLSPLVKFIMQILSSLVLCENTSSKIKGLWNSIFYLTLIFKILDSEEKQFYISPVVWTSNPFRSKSPSHPHFLCFGLYCRVHRLLDEIKPWSTLLDSHVTPQLLMGSQATGADYI